MRRWVWIAVVLVAGVGLAAGRSFSQAQAPPLRQTTARLANIQNYELRTASSSKNFHVPYEWGQLVSVQAIGGTNFLLFFQSSDGLVMTPAVTLIDSGAHADSVYDFVLPRQHTFRRIFACKGVDYLSKPGLVQEGSTKRGSIRLWAVATYPAKDRVFARMKIPRPGPGYLHLPDWATDEYLEQLTGEKKIAVRDKRTRTRKTLYVKTYHRNEALDLTVYCQAGLFVLQHFIAPAIYRDLGKLAEMVAKGQLPETLRPRVRRVRSQGLM